jgi:hypothetical protein
MGLRREERSGGRPGVGDPRSTCPAWRDRAVARAHRPARYFIAASAGLRRKELADAHRGPVELLRERGLRCAGDQ